MSQALRCLLLLSFVFGEVFGEPPSLRTIRVDRSMEESIATTFGWTPSARADEYVEFRLSMESVLQLGEYLHHERGRCGGFEDVTDAGFSLKSEPLKISSKRAFRHRSFSPPTVEGLLSDVSENAIHETIAELSSFPTRRYSTREGVAAAKRIAERITELAAGRSDVTVELIDHSAQNRSWIMPSVIARIEGTESSESVIVGGHLDSINANPFVARAPGADDDASGIAAGLEAFRVVLASGAKPRNRVEFMAYSAEEVGLWGSQAIAKWYRSENRNVKGVMQLDMVAYPGKDRRLYMITDNVDSNLSLLASQLAQKYDIEAEVGHTRCGYACSDHASWMKAGYPAIFPFEAADEESNPNIHTANDTIENAPHMDHAAKFAKLAVAYLWNMAYERPSLLSRR